MSSSNFISDSKISSLVSFCNCLGSMVFSINILYKYNSSIFRKIKPANGQVDDGLFSTELDLLL